MKIEAGDRVIYRGRHKGTILEIYDGSAFGFRKGKALIDFEGGEMICFISNIEIDKEWHREERLKELGMLDEVENISDKHDRFAFREIN